MPPYQPERHFGYFEIEDVCSAPGCDQPAVAVLPIHPKETGPGVLWACHDHALTVADAYEAASVEGPRPPSREIVRTCEILVGGSPCGAMATHVQVFRVRKPDGTPELAASSVCLGHAGEAA